ncbi:MULTISPECIES: glycosyltransferase family 2 protein [Rhizobium]|uniref:Succinoglycan biosynthesis protein ExoM n=1 Tax=Rhizobium metallidurans TaxID=1265931 RepID=A0A7W6GAX6_9HYPH|nr:glycosyltransferase family 2 protein [Rhizobium sp. AN80A]MBB3965048.1 succinoglycan biosynthesis protein ExoM [Rhizobium metallidurans]
MNQPKQTRQLQIDIGICTYRRASLDEALLSLAVLEVPPGARLRIIVADNDKTPSARERVDALRPRIAHEIAYVHCPASNISIARNACLDNATGDFLAFIDDDEDASEDWLVELLSTARATKADAVLGPVRSVYADSAPRWMRVGDFHSTLPVWVDGEIRTGYTCNVLLRLSSPSLAGRRFNLALGHTGGEDTEFFSHMHEAGGKIAFAEKAYVYEPVTENRADLSWLAKRRFRFGQTHGRLLQETSSGLNRPKQIALATAKAGFCYAAALACIFSAVPRYRYALRGIMHSGVVSGLLGVREIRQYGTAEAA